MRSSQYNKPPQLNSPFKQLDGRATRVTTARQHSSSLYHLIRVLCTWCSRSRSSESTQVSVSCVTVPWAQGRRTVQAHGARPSTLHPHARCVPPRPSQCESAAILWESTG